MENLYSHATQAMREVFKVLERKVPQPVAEAMGKGYHYRFREKTIYQAIVQKLVRVLTGLEAMSLLSKAGLVQEQASIQRMLDEFCEDVDFLCLGLISNDVTDIHDQYLSDFYEEEFDKPDDAIGSTQKRKTIPRKKVQAFISKDRGTGYDQSSTKEVLRTVQKTYSGYLHGASPQIMELYYGEPPSFHIQGGTNSPFYSDHMHDMLNYYYRAICTFSVAAIAFGEDDLCRQIMTYSNEFARMSGREDHLRETGQ